MKLQWKKKNLKQLCIYLTTVMLQLQNILFQLQGQMQKKELNTNIHQWNVRYDVMINGK